MDKKIKIGLLIILIITIAIIFSIFIKNKCGDNICQKWESRKGSCVEDCGNPIGSLGSKVSVKSITTIKEPGVKSMDWSHTNNLIAFGKYGKDEYFDVFIMNPDGSKEICLTCNKTGVPQRHNGNPAWHPTGEYIIFTAQRENAPKNMDQFAIPGSGLFNDLWLTTTNGDKFYQLTNYSGIMPIRNVIHPQFSHDGDKVFWAERVENGPSLGGGWVLKIADFVIKNKRPELRNIKILTPGEKESAFYESHAFSNDDKKILFTGDLETGQIVYGMDIYEYNLETGELIRLTKTDNDWDEHAHYSPDGTKIAWFSQTGYGTDWSKVVENKHFDLLKSELWIMDSDGSNKQRLTYFNEDLHEGYVGNNIIKTVVSDSSWSPDGKSLAVLLAYDKARGMNSKIVIIELE